MLRRHNSSRVAGQTSSAPQAPQQQGCFSQALLVLSCFPRARLERLDLNFRISPGLMLSPALAAFFLSSRRALEHVACLWVNCTEVSQLPRDELHGGEGELHAGDSVPSMTDNNVCGVLDGNVIVRMGY